MALPDSVVNDDGTETHIGCGGGIYYFKEGWICSKCREDGDYPWQAASTVRQGSTGSAYDAMQANSPGALPVASTGEPSTL